MDAGVVIRELCAVFPDRVGRWWAALDAHARTTQHSIWQRLLGDIEDVELRAVFDRMVRGELELPSQWLVEDVPRMLRRAVLERRARSQARTREPEGPPIAWRPGVVRLKPLVERAIALRESGYSRDAIRHELLAMIPQDDPYEAPRYDCLICRDLRGLVLVASYEIVAAARAGGVEAAQRVSHHTFVVPCCCSDGLRHVERLQERYGWTIYHCYDERRYYRWSRMPYDVEELAALVAWSRSAGSTVAADHGFV